jgi:hypothetical protein
VPTVSKTVPVIAEAWDNVGIIRVEFYLDEDRLIAASAGPETYRIGWDTTAVAAGVHELTAIAFDAAGHRTSSAAVTVVVDNPNGDGQAAQSLSSTLDSLPPTVPTGLRVTQVTGDSVTLAWDASDDNVAVVAYRLYEYVRVNPHYSYWRLEADNIPVLSALLTALP